MEDSERAVAECMDSLDAQFTALARHPFVVAAKTGREETAAVRESHEHSFLQLLASSQNSAAESEKIVAATFRWLAARNRGAFIKSMFLGRYACASLHTDTRLIETALGIEQYFSIKRTADGFVIGEPRPLDKERTHTTPRRASERPRPPPRSRRGRRAEPSSGPVSHRELARPVLGAADRLKLLDDLDQAAADEARCQEDELGNPQNSSYLKAATRSPGDPESEDGASAKSDNGASAKSDNGASAESDNGASAKSDNGASAKSDNGASAKSDNGASAKSDNGASAKSDGASSPKLTLPLTSQMDWAASSEDEDA